MILYYLPAWGQAFFKGGGDVTAMLCLALVSGI
jgi:hypothetical protein